MDAETAEFFRCCNEEFGEPVLILTPPSKKRRTAMAQEACEKIEEAMNEVREYLEMSKHDDVELARELKKREEDLALFDD